MPNIAELASKYLFGAICVCAGLLVLASRYLFPGAINAEIYPVGYVLLMMGAIALFSRQYMRLVNPGLGSLTSDLASHLNQIGVKATEIKSDSPEAIKHGVKVFGNDSLDVPPWGVIKVEGRNVEFVEPVVMNVPGGGGGAGKRRMDAMNVTIRYLLRARIGDEGDFSATSLVGWEGGSLADALNSDEELKRIDGGPWVATHPRQGAQGGLLCLHIAAGEGELVRWDG